MKKILITILLLFFAVNLYAATLDVGIGSGYTYATIQAAVNASVAGDTVLVYPGTYNESVRIPNSKQGTSTAPITIKAQFPARQPLDGGSWANIVANRSIINASGTPSVDATPSNGDDFGIYNEQGPSQYAISNIIIDGFYIQNATDSGIYFTDDSYMWIKNNVIVDAGYSTTLGGENWGGIVLVRTGNSIVQNNQVQLTASGASSTGMFNLDGNAMIVEYNECDLNTPSSGNGRCFYVRLSSVNSKYRYNYINAASLANTQLTRFRDFTGLTMTNNYIYSSVAQNPFLIHENDAPDNITESHNISNNTFYFAQGATSNVNIVNLGYITNSNVNNNILVSGISDTGSCGYGRAYQSCNFGTSSPNSNLTIDSTVYYNVTFIDSGECGSGNNCSPTSSQNTNPNIIVLTGCASSVNNNTYGANLDISSIPYKKCDGTPYPIVTGFGMPPSPPTSLSVQ